MHTNATDIPAESTSRTTQLKAFRLMATARAMAKCYEENRATASKYVHATSAGHEAIQIAAGLQLRPYDFAAPYYRDDSMLLSMGLTPYELMLQLCAKADDPFSAGRSYYSHPSLKRAGFPTIPHQSSATGMQAIPATGMAHGIKYKEARGLNTEGENPIVLCSLGDGSVTEGEVAEAFQMAALKQLPIIFLVQDNGWSISAGRSETRSSDAYQYAAGFKGLERRKCDGSDFDASLVAAEEAFSFVRNMRAPLLLHAKCPLLGHHTSGVRREWYRGGNELLEAGERDPLPLLRNRLLHEGIEESFLLELEAEVWQEVNIAYKAALAAPEPETGSVTKYIFAETPVKSESGTRKPVGAEKTLMVDAALHAVDEILQEYPEALLYGQDVGGALGGVFREAAQLAIRHGETRVFNTPIQEAYIIGSTAGMSAVGLKPIVEVQFADYIWPGINQLASELSRSSYLSAGKFPVQALIRVPTGAYGSGGPYHSSSVESALLSIKGIKIVYPGNAADMKGLMKAAFLDPNPVIMLEHKGLYWSKVPGTEDAKTFEPAADYIIPLGKAAVALEADALKLEAGETMVIITYGMGVYWAKNAAKAFPGCVEVIDLRTLHPLDFEMCEQAVKRHGKALVLTEESIENSFAESLAGRLSVACFKYLDAPVQCMGALNVPAIPLNSLLEKEVLPDVRKTEMKIREILES
ncbi:MAG: thiamine pyrophosphate-dependent enzyme [Bacteroidota bacterium]